MRDVCRCLARKGDKMDQVAAVIRLLSEGGWRLGVPLTIVGALVLVAHRQGLPEACAVAPYVGWATLGLIAGIAFTVTSAVAGMISLYGQRRARRRIESDLRANLSALLPRERATLLEILRSGQVRLKVHITSVDHALLEKGVLRPVDQNTVNRMCEVPKFLRDNRVAIIRELE
jgi:hypothetical protein